MITMIINIHRGDLTNHSMHLHPFDRLSEFLFDLLGRSVYLLISRGWVEI